MDVRFEDDDLDRLELDEKFNARLPEGIVRSFRKAMQYIRAASDQRDLRLRPGWHFERYRAEPGCFSLKLNDQYRLIIGFDESAPDRKTAVVFKITDYH